MRIISGKLKGRKILPLSELKARPTTDFAKEGLFNILENRTIIEGSTVLDLFSGTGGISLEFISRDAASVTAVEINRTHAEYIKKSAKQLGIDNLTVLQADALKYINACRRKFDIIFADPPYALAALPAIPDAVLSAGLLEDDGIMILEHGKNNDFSGHPNFMEMRKYGSVHFSFFTAYAKEDNQER